MTITMFLLWQQADVNLYCCLFCYIIYKHTMTPNEIKQFRNYMRKCISMNFTLEEKECITKKKKEIKEAGEAIRKNNGGKNPILGF